MDTMKLDETIILSIIISPIITFFCPRYSVETWNTCDSTLGRDTQ